MAVNKHQAPETTTEPKPDRSNAYTLGQSPPLNQIYNQIQASKAALSATSSSTTKISNLYLTTWPKCFLSCIHCIRFSSTVSHKNSRSILLLHLTWACSINIVRSSSSSRTASITAVLHQNNMPQVAVSSTTVILAVVQVCHLRTENHQLNKNRLVMMIDFIARSR